MSDLVGNPEDRFSHNDAHLMKEPAHKIPEMANGDALVAIL